MTSGRQVLSSEQAMCDESHEAHPNTGPHASTLLFLLGCLYAPQGFLQLLNRCGTVRFDGLTWAAISLVSCQLSRVL